MATKPIDPTLPSMGMACMRTLLRPSDGVISGGGCRTMRPVGTDGAS
jgi:hypothetical protein